MKKIILILTCMLFLVACENNTGEGEKSINYQLGFPEEISPSLMEFLLFYSTPMYTVYFKDENQYIFSQFDVEKNPEEIVNYANTENQIKEYFSPLINSDNIQNTFKDLTEKFEAEMFEMAERTLQTHPEVILEDDNIITVRTSVGEKTIDLVEELASFELQPSDELEISIPSANKQSFLLEIRNAQAEGVNEFIYIYMNQDFSNFTAVSGDTDLFSKSIESGELEDFKELVFEAELNNRYTLLTDTNHVFDRENKTIHRLDDETIYPSQDGKYVFLQGKNSPLKEGVHHIQRTEDYLEGNNQYYAEFELNYDEIADKLDFDSVGIKSANIVYFNKDYAILHLEFSAAFAGAAGSTNVIIDFQEDKDNPAYYLVDLGISL